MDISDEDSSVLSDEAVEDLSVEKIYPSLESVKVGQEVNPNPILKKKTVPKEQKSLGKSHSKRSKSGVVVKEEKQFMPTTSCCHKNCFSEVSLTHQQDFFNKFHALSCKAEQDLYLSGCMYNKEIKTRLADETKKHIEALWNYNLYIQELDKEVLVCRKFMLDLFQVTARRFRTIQNRLKSGNLNFSETRGTHFNRPHRIDDEVWLLIKEHWSLIPNTTPAHQPVKSSRRLYFDNPELTVAKLYSMFKEFYREKTSKDLTMKYNTYFKFFKKHFKYFRTIGGSDAPYLLTIANPHVLLHK